MNWEELLKRAPKLTDYIKNMPPDIKNRCVYKGNTTGTDHSPEKL